MLGEPILALIRRELKRLSDGIKIEVDEVEAIVRTEVLKREVVEGEEAEAAKARVNKFYKKSMSRHRKTTYSSQETTPPTSEESVTERLLRDEGKQQTIQQKDRGDE